MIEGVRFEHDPELFAARWVLGLARGDELVRRAEAALNAGIYGPALAELGSLRDPASRDVRELVDQALDELGATRPDRLAACYLSARADARRIVAGDVSPEMGARKIWREVCGIALDLGNHCLSPFLYWGDECMDADTEERAEFCEQRILEAAKELLGEPPPFRETRR